MKDLHHANLLVGAPEEAETYLRSICSNLGFKLAGNPDFVSIRTDTFGIDEARDLTRMASRRALGEGQIFFISALRLTMEAQNALLKTFEDPFPDTHFFLRTQEEALIIPTLRSRMKVIPIYGSTVPDCGEAKQFLSLSLKDRLKFTKAFVDKEKNLSVFLDDLMPVLRKQGVSQKLMEYVYNARRFANDTSASSRLIIEHLSLVI